MKEKNRRPGNGTRHNLEHDPLVTVEVDDVSILLKAYELEFIRQVAHGVSIRVATKALGKNENSLWRVAERIRVQTGKNIARPVPLICWFAYAAGLVKL